MSAIIGLYGAAGVGKDQFAIFTEDWVKNDLCEVFSYYQTSFAEPVYELSGVIFGVTPEFLGERRKKELRQWFTVSQRQLERARDLWDMWKLNDFVDFSDVWPKFEEQHLTTTPPFEWNEIDEQLYSVFISPREILQKIGTELGRTMVYTNVWIDLLKSRIKQKNADVTLVTDIRFDNEAVVIRDFPNVTHSINVEIVSPTSPHVIKTTHVSEAGVSERLIDHTFVNQYTGLTNLQDDVRDFLDVEVYVYI